MSTKKTKSNGAEHAPISPILAEDSITSAPLKKSNGKSNGTQPSNGNVAPVYGPAEIDGFIDAYSERYTNFNVVLTGGNCTHFVPHLKNRIFADPDLIFKGLYAISEHNNV